MKELLLIICLFLMKTKSMIEAESESLLSQKQTSSLVKLKGLLHKKNAYVSLSIFLLVHGCHSTVPSLCQALCQKNTSFFSLTMFNSILENVKSIPSITSSAIIACLMTILFNNKCPVHKKQMLAKKKIFKAKPTTVILEEKVSLLKDLTNSTKTISELKKELLQYKINNNKKSTLSIQSKVIEEKIFLPQDNEKIQRKKLHDTEYLMPDKDEEIIGNLAKWLKKLKENYKKDKKEIKNLLKTKTGQKFTFMGSTSIQKCQPYLDLLYPDNKKIIAIFYQLLKELTENYAKDIDNIQKMIKENSFPTSKNSFPTSKNTEEINLVGLTFMEECDKYLALLHEENKDMLTKKQPVKKGMTPGN